MAMKKSIFGLIVAMLMMIALFPATVSAETKTYDCEGDDLTYTLDDNGTFTVSGDGQMANCEIDEEWPWHSDRNDIKTVVIESGVTSIGNCAFSGCDNLTTVTLPEGITSIGNEAFSLSIKLRSITIPESVSHLGNTAFNGCVELDSVTIKRNDETPLEMDIYAFAIVGTRQATIEWTGEVLPEGAYIEYSVDPEGAGYSVNGNILCWDKSVPNSVQLITKVVLPEYEIQFVNDDGTVLQSNTYTRGEMPSYDGEEPTKPSTTQYSYEFAGWTPEIVEAAGDATYTATYTSELREYDLTFDLGGGTLDGKTGTFTMTCKYGDTIKLPDAPTKEGYKFLYWKGSEYDAGASYTVEGAHTFTAEWEAADSETKNDDNNKTPATGDDTPTGTMIAIMVGAMLLLGAAIRFRKKAGCGE